jgi:leucyl-tRNA synthetase
MGEVMSDPNLRERGDEVNQLVQDLVEVVRQRDESDLRAMLEADEAATYGGASGFLAREFDAEIKVYAEDDPDVEDPGGKAGNAQPLRPAVHVE